MMKFGWKKDPVAVQAVLRTLPFPRFKRAAKNLKGLGAGHTVVIPHVVKKVLGSFLPAQNQPRGTCVSRGWSRGVDYTECVEIFRGEPEEFNLVSHAFVYGLCREIGGDMSTEDGAVGAWAAKAVTIGNIKNDDCADKDAGYDDLAVEWGARGVPQKYKDLASQRGNKIQTVSLITNPEDARDAVCNYYSLPVCSGQGFTMTRDSGGRCRPEGSWAHCMLWSGYRDDKKQFLVEQSWGQNTPSGPIGDIEIPDNCFWIDWDVAAGMLAEEDSFAMSQFAGFPAQKFSWVV